VGGPHPYPPHSTHGTETTTGVSGHLKPEKTASPPKTRPQRREEILSPPPTPPQALVDQHRATNKFGAHPTHIPDDEQKRSSPLSAPTRAPRANYRNKKPPPHHSGGGKKKEKEKVTTFEKKKTHVGVGKKPKPKKTNKKKKEEIRNEKRDPHLRIFCKGRNRNERKKNRRRKRGTAGGCEDLKPPPPPTKRKEKKNPGGGCGVGVVLFWLGCEVFLIKKQRRPKDKKRPKEMKKYKGGTYNPKKKKKND